MKAIGMAVAFVGLCASASNTMAEGFTKAGELHQQIQAHTRIAAGTSRQPEDYEDAALAVGYIEGIVDVLAKKAICPTSDMTVVQVVAITDKYLTAHPEVWDNPAAPEVFAALSGVFPCSKR